MAAAKPAGQKQCLERQSRLQVGDVEVGAEAEQEVGLVEEAEVRQTFVGGGGLNAREIHMRGDVAIARIFEPGGRRCRPLASSHGMSGKGSQRSSRMRG